MERVLAQPDQVFTTQLDAVAVVVTDMCEDILMRAVWNKGGQFLNLET